MSSATIPIERVWFESRPRAIGLGTNASSRIAASTRSRVVSVTRGLSLITRDTVWWDTPARAATSRIVGGLLSPLTACLMAAYVTSHILSDVTDHNGEARLRSRLALPPRGPPRRDLARPARRLRLAIGRPAARLEHRARARPGERERQRRRLFPDGGRLVPEAPFDPGRVERQEGAHRVRRRVHERRGLARRALPRATSLRLHDLPL